ncbi:MAG: hypothetical protein II304_03360 [Bacteroidales bacterium]|nr:hypothetical protein [Bacteroidales bacterium]
MNVDLRFPNINATTPEGQMAQMQSYMHQLVQQLNWALNSLDEAVAGKTSSVVISKPKEALTPEEAVNTFNSIKSLIIKSADIVKAYEETIKTNFDGEYLAVSEFGEYSEKTSAAIEENSKGLTAVYTNVQTIGEDVKNTNAYIKRGLLGYDENGNAVYGIAVGETDEHGAYKKYAWFTANKLSFFDNNGYEAAYISNNKLYIRDAVFLGTVQFGGYKADTSDGLAFTWIGGE